VRGADDPALRSLAPQDLLEHAAGLVALGECDDRTAEAAAGEPRADRSGRERRRDESIERRRGDLVVVAQACVALGEERAGGGGAAPAEPAARRPPAFVPGGDVGDAPRTPRLELATALRVAGGLEAVTLARVDDDELELLRQGDPAML